MHKQAGVPNLVTQPPGHVHDVHDLMDPLELQICNFLQILVLLQLLQQQFRAAWERASRTVRMVQPCSACRLLTSEPST